MQLQIKYMKKLKNIIKKYKYIYWKIQMEKNNKNLESLRKKIEEIDSQILDLLEKRSVSSFEIGQIKQKENRQNNYIKYSAFRPIREAEIHKKINMKIENNKNYNDFAIHHIWRTIIAASTLLQNDIQIYIDRKDKEILQRYSDYFFGFNIDCRVFSRQNFNNLIQDVSNIFFIILKNDEKEELNIFKYNQQILFVELSDFLIKNEASKNKVFMIANTDEDRLKNLPYLLYTKDESSNSYMLEIKDENPVDIGKCQLLGKYIKLF